MRKLLTVCFLLAGSLVFAQRTIIFCGQFIDVKNQQVIKQMSIVVEGNKITDIQNGYIVPLLCFAVIFYFGWKGHQHTEKAVEVLQ